MPTKPITKAVIAAGGWSTRFLPAVKSYAKHLVPILNKPQIQYVVEELIGAGITEICIVHRQGEETIKSFFSPNPNLEDYLAKNNKSDLISSLKIIENKAHFTFLSQSPKLPYGNGTPIIVASDFIGQDNFVYLWGDDLTIEKIPGNFLKNLISQYQRYKPDIAIATQTVPDSEVHKYGTMRYADNPTVPNQVVDVPEKLPLGQNPSNDINCARFIVTPKIIEVLKQQQLDRGELWFTQGASYFAKNGLVISIRHQDYDSTWATTGDPLSWLKVNIALALKDEKYQQEIVKLFSSKSS